MADRAFAERLGFAGRCDHLFRFLDTCDGGPGRSSQSLVDRRFIGGRRNRRDERVDHRLVAGLCTAARLNRREAVGQCRGETFRIELNALEAFAIPVKKVPNTAPRRHRSSS